MRTHLLSLVLPATAIACLGATSGCTDMRGAESGGTELAGQAQFREGQRPVEDENEREFPPPQTLADFDGKWFDSKRAVAIVEPDPERDGYRAIGIDVDAAQLVYQVIGPLDEMQKVMGMLTEAGLSGPGCSVGAGIFPPPPIPPPTCGGRRCSPYDYLVKAQMIAAISCP